MPPSYLSPNSKNELILRPRKVKFSVLTLVSAVFTAGGVMMINSGDQMGWLVAFFFGLCMMIFITNMLPNAAYLRLTETGFEQRSMFKTTRVSWDDVEYFREIHIESNHVVGFDYTENYGKHQKMRTLGAVLTGAEGALFDNFGMKTEELAELMEEWKARSST